MKKSEIKIGAVYRNGKGRERKVIDRGDYPLYTGQGDHDCILYEIVKDGSKKNCSAGQRGNMTATSFASWAKEEVKDV
jgi:hypothetical protein